MVRKLKYHEQRLLRHVNFEDWKSDAGHRSALVRRRYHIQKPDDYSAYNRLSGSLRQLAHRLADLEPEDPVRKRHEELLLGKLFDMGLITSGGNGKGLLSDVEKLSVSTFARRRLPVVMLRMGMGDNLRACVGFVEQGHVRVGTEVVTDPAYLVTRNMEDFLTWVDSSKIKRSIMKYRDNLDDFELL